MVIGKKEKSRPDYSGLLQLYVAEHQVSTLTVVEMLDQFLKLSNRLTSEAMLLSAQVFLAVDLSCYTDNVVHDRTPNSCNSNWSIPIPKLTGNPIRYTGIYR